MDSRLPIQGFLDLNLNINLQHGMILTRMFFPQSGFDGRPREWFNSLQRDSHVRRHVTESRFSFKVKFNNLVTQLKGHNMHFQDSDNIVFTPLPNSNTGGFDDKKCLNVTIGEKVCEIKCQIKDTFLCQSWTKVKVVLE